MAACANLCPPGWSVIRNILPDEVVPDACGLPVARYRNHRIPELQHHLAMPSDLAEVHFSIHSALDVDSILPVLAALLERLGREGLRALRLAGGVPALQVAARVVAREEGQAVARPSRRRQRR